MGRGGVGIDKAGQAVDHKFDALPGAVTVHVPLAQLTLGPQFSHHHRIGTVLPNKPMGRMDNVSLGCIWIILGHKVSLNVIG